MARYNLNDIEYPSVTEILDVMDKPAIVQWAVNQAIKYIEFNKDDADVLQKAKFEYRNVGKEAMDIGSQAHDLIEHYIKFGLDKSGKNEYNESVQNAFLSFLEWEKSNKVKWVKSEFTICDVDLCYAGMLDAICEIDGKIYLIDFKTSTGFYPEYELQITAYLKAYNKTAEVKATNIGILRIDKNTGIPEFKEYEIKERIYQAFINLLDFFYNYKNRRLRNNPRVK